MIRMKWRKSRATGEIRALLASGCVLCCEGLVDRAPADVVLSVFLSFPPASRCAGGPRARAGGDGGGAGAPRRGGDAPARRARGGGGAPRGGGVAGAPQHAGALAAGAWSCAVPACPPEWMWLFLPAGCAACALRTRPAAAALACGARRPAGPAAKVPPRSLFAFRSLAGRRPRTYAAADVLPPSSVVRSPSSSRPPPTKPPRRSSRRPPPSAAASPSRRRPSSACSRRARR